MSSTGTRKSRDVQSRANDSIIESDKNFISNLKLFSGESDPIGGVVGQGLNSSPNTPTGNYLAREGDSMIGPIALGPPIDFTIEVDANNTINISPNLQNNQYSSNVQLDDLQPNSSVLDIIAGAAFDGQILVLRTFAPTVPYTISQGTIPNGGNIQTPDSNDIVLGDLQMLVLVFDEALIINANTGGTWRVLAGASGGGGPGGLSDPIILNEVDLGDIGFLNQLIDWSAANFYRAKLNGDITITMENLPVAGKWEQLVLQFTQDIVGSHSVTFTDVFANAVVPIINPGPNSITTVVFYAYNDGVNKILAFDVLSNFGPVIGPEYGHFTKVANQPPPLTVGTPALFDSVVSANGLAIDLAGNISGLRAGHIYECECFMSILNNVNPAACLNFQFFDVANALLIGTHGDAILTGQLTLNSAQPSARAIFVAAADTDTLEVHFTFNNDLIDTFMFGMGIAGTPESYIIVKDITGLVGGAGTVINFPNVLINDVITVSPAATLNIDLSLAQHWVVNLTQNLTVTFINIPPDIDTSEQVVIEYVQDVVGGHTVVYTDTISPSNPPIDTSATAREVVTGFVRRENGGSYVYNLYLVGN